MKLKMKMIWIMAMIAIIVLMSNIVSAPKGSGEYIIEGDKVYIDDENVRIVAMPHTIYGSDWVTFNLTSKKYEGGINVLFGFDTKTKPKKAELYIPGGIETEFNFTCDSPYWYNYTLSPNHFWCWEDINNASYLIYDHDFDSADLGNNIAYWNETIYWQDISDRFNNFEYSYDNKTTWYYLNNVNIVANQTYTMRSFIEVPPIKDYTSKYDIGIYPSSYGKNIPSAVADDKFYFLDPLVSGFNELGCVFYAAETTDSIDKICYNGTDWNSASTLIDYTAMATSVTVEAASSTTNEMMLISTLGASAIDTYSYTCYNGTVFNSVDYYTGVANTDLYQLVDSVAEQESGDLMFLMANYSSYGYILKYKEFDNECNIKEQGNTTMYFEESYQPTLLQAASVKNSDKIIVVVENINTDLWMQMWDGNDWGTPSWVSFAGGNTLNVDVDCGTEICTILYSDDTTQAHYLRMYNVTSGQLSAEETLTDYGVMTVEKVCSNPYGIDEFVGLTEVTDYDLQLFHWENGAEDLDTEIETTLTGSAGYSQFDCVFLNSTHSMVVWSDTTLPDLSHYSINTGNSFGGELDCIDDTFNPVVDRLSKDPYSDMVILTELDANSDLGAQVWDGTQWTDNSGKFDANVAVAVNSKAHDIAWFYQGDTCTAPVAGNWLVTDECIWNTPQNVPGNLYLACTGIERLSALFTFTGSNQYVFIDSGCQIYIESGGELR